MRIFNWLFNWFRSFLTRRHFKKIKFVTRVSEIPNNIKREAYIVERSGRKLWLVFDCPCDKVHRLTINLSDERTPFWLTEIKGSRLNVSPSIWLGDECYSHFWIKNSNIIQTPDSGERDTSTFRDDFT
jgi:hypothetical protein